MEKPIVVLGPGMPADVVAKLRNEAQVIEQDRVPVYASGTARRYYTPRALMDEDERAADIRRWNAAVYNRKAGRRARRGK